MSYAELVWQEFESAGLTKNIDGEDFSWIKDYFCEWYDVAYLFFVRKEEKVMVYAKKVSRFSTFFELCHASNKKYFEYDDELSTAAFVMVALQKMIYMANQSEPWEIASLMAEVQYALGRLPDWKPLYLAFYVENSIENMKSLSREELATQQKISERARNAAMAKHKKQNITRQP